MFEHGCGVLLFYLFLIVFGIQELDQTTQLNRWSTRSSCLWKGI